MTEKLEGVKEIDLSCLFRVSGPKRSEVDALIANSLATDGAFVATSLPDSGDLDQKMSKLMRFFDLPSDVKFGCAVQSYQSGNSNTYRGYYPLPEVADWTHKEYYDIGPEPAMGIPNIPGGVSFCEANVWPREGDLPNWRSEMLNQLHELRDLACQLLAAIARGLDLNSKPFVDASAGRNASMRLLSRPVLAKSCKSETPTADENDFLNDLEILPDGRQIVTGRHVDENLISILWQSSAGGLQMEGRDGIWKEAYPRPGTLSVHCGTLLAPLTGDRLTGTPHRVASNGACRTSMGHFLEPDFETNVRAPESGIPVTYAQHLVNLFPDRFTESDAA